MIETKNTEEVIQKEGVTPVPPTPVTQTETAPTVEVKPVENNTEDKKRTLAFIKMRQENAEMKRKLANVQANVATPPVVTPKEEAAPAVIAVSTPAPTPVNVVNGIADLEKQAISELSIDKDLAKVPGAVVDILDMIDNDPRLSRLYNEIDPKLAIREAKGMYLEKQGISIAPVVPVSTPTSGGMGQGSVDLERLINHAETLKPGTKEWHIAVAKVNAELKRLEA